MIEICELCESAKPYDFHHLIPRTLHSNKWFKKRYTQKELSTCLGVCKDCHKSIHNLIPDEKEMGREYNTKEKLLSHPEVKKYVKWRKKRGRLQRKEN